MRSVRLRSHLQQARPALVVYEETSYMPTKTTAASMVYGGLVSTISTWCEEMCVPYTGVTVSSVRNLITEKANTAKAKNTPVSDVQVRNSHRRPR